MHVKIFCPIWGMVPDYITEVNGSLEDVFQKVKQAGYDGIEMAVPFSDKQKVQIAGLLKSFQLELVALQWAADGATPKEYLSAYEVHIRNASEMNPLLINSHTGRDYYSFDDICAVLDAAAELAEQLKVKIVHETHRGRFSFHPYFLQPYLTAYPSLRLTADFSHWCNVSESFLQDQSAHVTNAIARTDHIHARVGHPQGSQVSDPRAPEWKDALQHHLKWWDAVVRLHKDHGTSAITITPEFGPGHYMPLLPYTQQPVADQWAINRWMKDVLRERYGGDVLVC